MTLRSMPIYDWHVHTIALALVLVAGVFLGLRYCWGAVSSSPVDGTVSDGLGSQTSTTLSSRSSAYHIVQGNEAYERVREEESDAGDWQVDDFVGQHFGSQLAGDEKCEERKEYDPNSVVETIEKISGSWRLYGSVLGALVQFWAALAFMYWSLLYRNQEMMNCDAYPHKAPHSFFVRHACQYTLACLRGFPILAANMVLVLMTRILIQTRVYYSILKMGYVLDFQNSPFLRTIWPWACGISMLQGGLHFVLKMYFDTEQFTFDIYVLRVVREFVLPGTIFFSFLFRYADIENTLVPLNRIAEQDYTASESHCPWLGKLQVLNERVLAFDARHRDVVGMTQDKVTTINPTIHDVVVDMIENYEEAHKIWQRQKHRGWGLFRSMWPASILLDLRLDREDPDTRAWLTVFAAHFVGWAVMATFSLYLLFCLHYGSLVPYDIIFDIVRMLLGGQVKPKDTETMLAQCVLLFHGLLIVIFIYRTVRNMFYRSIHNMWATH